ncbi:hypothetical protein [Actinokineospora sp.]|uniref:hypothetical protein n=1 Tax=Actinokineospora sp. TaxID=1872133 RepID=UPI003D6AD332
MFPGEFGQKLQSLILRPNYLKNILVEASGVRMADCLGGDSFGNKSLGYAPVDVVQALDDPGLDRMPAETALPRLVK